MHRVKGFIGPLGDDIPSIFPIVAGVLLFITSLLFLNSQVSLTAEDFKLRQATQELAYLATKKGFYSVEEFESMCKSSLTPYAVNNNLKFAVVVKKFCGQGVDLFNTNPFNPDETQSRELRWVEKMYCTNPAPAVVNPDRKSAFEEFMQARDARFGDTDKLPRDVISLSYPVAVPCPDLTSPYNGLGMINVLVWK